MSSTSKIQKAKPQFYAIVFPELKEIAKRHGYNLVLHGSMRRDMDLVAIPWIDNPKTHLELLAEFCSYLGVRVTEELDGKPDYLYSVLPGGRHSYVINLQRSNQFNNYIDEQWYVDICITPKG